MANDSHSRAEHSRGKPPFFIVGSGRSGTTLLQVLIDAHPDLVIPPESHWYDRIVPIIPTFGDLRAAENRRRFISALLSDAYIRQWNLDASAEDIERRMQRADGAGAADALFSLYAEKHGAGRWGDKTPDHIRWLEAIRSDFPDAKLIHLVRDGRDRAEARRRMIWGPSTALGMAREWRGEVMRWKTFCDAHGAAGTLVVRYEDLVRGPREALQRVFEFLDEPWVDTLDLYTSTALTRTLSTTQRKWHSSLAAAISTKKIGIYHRSLSRREIEIFESVARDALVEYGYRPDFAVPRGATLVERARSALVDRGLRWYRKLLHPYAAWLEVQFRLRLAHRHLVGSSKAG